MNEEECCRQLILPRAKEEYHTGHKRRRYFINVHHRLTTCGMYNSFHGVLQTSGIIVIEA
jgi:hypothetical protein